VQRLFIAPLSKEMSWLLPLGLVGLLLLFFGTRLKWPVTFKHQALLLWGGWLVTGGVFFSIAGFFHEYYLSLLAPASAALAGIAIMEMWHLRRRFLWFSLFLLTIVIGDTMVYQVYTSESFVKNIAWLPALYVLFTLGILLLVADGIYSSWQRRQQLLAGETGLEAGTFEVKNSWRFLAPAGLTLLITAVMLTPLIWSGLTNSNSSSNQSLPADYDGRSSGPGRLGGLQVNSSLLAFLQKNTQSNRYLMAVPSSMQGADYVLATGRPVLYMGGFMGQDNVVSASQLQDLVAKGDLRYIYWGGGRGGRMQGNDSAWVTSNCQIVSGYEVTTSNSGAPDGTLNGGGANVPGGFGANMNVSLYDCLKK
jgi:4-amino-4-deoxy-L-arabinose transferase-like glycosyltransferase